MKRSKIFSSQFLLIGLICGMIIACEKDISDSPNKSSDDNSNQLLTSEQISELSLGRVLFYDKQLSVNNAVSCASCHKQSKAFADDVAFSVGFNRQLTTRNSMPIQNLGGFFMMFNEDFPTGHALFWDGRETILSEMVLRPMFNHIEMGITDMEYLVNKVKNISYYPVMFERDFGDPEITTERIGFALANFLQTMNSMESKFDQRMPLTAKEEFGRFLFESKYPCNSCHNVLDPNGYLTGGENFSPFANIGLDLVGKDKGFGAVSGIEDDNGKFKIPSLRNVALTAPYMHDGRFESLESVIDHYSEGMKNHSNLDDRLKDNSGMPLKLNISEQEKEAMVAFLHTMTDFRFISDPALSDPFK